MNVIESIKTCVFKKYIKTEGRASRSEFCYFVFFYIGVIVMSLIIVPYIEEITRYEFSSKRDYSGYLLFFVWIFGLGLLLPFNSVHIRRLNDINQPGLNWMATFAGLLIFGSILNGLTGGATGGLIAWIALIVYLIILTLCLKTGDKKDNKFGKNIYKKVNKKR
tara:strand:- start:2 stop:493 length:492 start_codon:yes stop_codon:yes gene_type:complete